MVRSKSIVAVAVAAALVLWFALEWSRESHPLERAGAVPTERVRTTSPPDGSAGPGEVPADLRETPGAVEADARAGASAPEPVAAPAPELPLPAPGALVVRVVDRDTHLPPQRFSVRLASETRFGSGFAEDFAPSLRLPLTPAEYAVLVTSAGYEPVELPPVRIASGETVTLDTVELAPGSGGVLVELLGCAAPETFTVELAGSGRRPCTRCVVGATPGTSPWLRTTPCAACGYAAESSKLSAGPDGRAEFADLAQGSYALRALDAKGRALGDERALALAAGETARVELDVSQWREVELEVLDTDGLPLSIEWARRKRLASAGPDRPADPADGVRVVTMMLLLRSGTRTLAVTSLVPPSPAAEGLTTFTGHKSGRGGWKPGERVDHARRPEEQLRPAPGAPRFEPAQVSCAVDARGLAVVGPVGPSEFEVRLTTEGFEATAGVPAGRETVLVRAQLRPRADATSPPRAETFRDLERMGAR